MKINKLQFELNEKDNECQKMKEQIMYLQRENMELKLNSSRSASQIGS